MKSLIEWGFVSCSDICAMDALESCWLLRENFSCLFFLLNLFMPHRHHLLDYFVRRSILKTHGLGVLHQNRLGSLKMGLGVQLWLQFPLHLVLKKDLVLLFTLSQKLVPLHFWKILLVYRNLVLVALLLLCEMLGFIERVVVTCLLLLAILAFL